LVGVFQLAKTKPKPETKKVKKRSKPRKVVAAPKPENTLRKFVLGASTIIGIGYILPNLATALVLIYKLSEFRINSQEAVVEISGTVLFFIASILLMALGVLIINGGTKFYKKSPSGEVVLTGVLLASFYLLCLGVGSALLASEMSLSVVLLVISPILIMVSTAVYTVPSLHYRLPASLLGIVGGILLAIAIFDLQPLQLVLTEAKGWDVPFLGPFMSMALLEGMVLILGSIAAPVHSLLSERKTKPMSHLLFSIIGLVYGIGLFVGGMLLSFSFLNLVWKARFPETGFALSEVPRWVFNIVIFWSASLVVLEIGGIILIISSCLGFAFAAKEFSGSTGP